MKQVRDRLTETDVDRIADDDAAAADDDDLPFCRFRRGGIPAPNSSSALIHDMYPDIRPQEKCPPGHSPPPALPTIRPTGKVPPRTSAPDNRRCPGSLMYDRCPGKCPHGHSPPTTPPHRKSTPPRTSAPDNRPLPGGTFPGMVDGGECPGRACPGSSVLQPIRYDTIHFTCIQNLNVSTVC